MASDAAVTAHYTTDDLPGRIEAALRAAGKDTASLTPDDIAPLEHMHTGGRRATRAAIDALGLKPGQRVADIGCGIGGTAREMARQYGLQVIGIDLTADYIAIARDLSQRTGLGAQTEFRLGSALDLPLADGSVDGAVIIHVGMNIADKRALLSEAARVLRPGARLALWDVMQGDNPAPIRFPVPWATSPDTSHLAAPHAYRNAAASAGLIAVSEDTYTPESEPPAEGKLPPLGPHLMMGPDAPIKIRNHKQNLSTGSVLPMQMVFRKPG